jgi:hypothetical protein
LDGQLVYHRLCRTHYTKTELLFLLSLKAPFFFELFSKQTVPVAHFTDYSPHDAFLAKLGMGRRLMQRHKQVLPNGEMERI